jgi:hypothetical protein
MIRARRHPFRFHDPSRFQVRPCIESLEDRWLPSVLTVTSTADSGPGTLRAEINAASNFDTIVFALPNPSTIQLTSGTLTISSAIQIIGPGASALTIHGNLTFSIFTVKSNPVTLTGLTISGGGGSQGGGITNQGILLVSHCVITNNQSTFVGGGFEQLGGSATISDCTISNNSATTTSTSDDGKGGGIFAAGQLTITNTTVSSNIAAVDGGGIALDDCILYLTNSRVVGNNVSDHVNGSGADGGGMFLFGSSTTINNSVVMGNSVMSDASGSVRGGGLSADGPIAIVASNIANNSASNGGSVGQPASGGGLFFDGPFTLDNCTVSGNHVTTGIIATGSAGNALGGGVSWNLNVGPATIINCTISGNVAAVPAFATTALAEGGGMSAQGAGGPITLQNTIIAANVAAVDTDFANMSTSMTALFNLIGDGTGFNFTNGGSNRVGTTQSPLDPKLAPLGNYGGPTPTMALLPGSQAIDTGLNGNVTTFTDQRGFPRIVNGTVDIGAFEFRALHLLALGAGPGGAPEVKVYDATSGALLLDFDAYDPHFLGGVRVALGDVDGDGVPDIITAPGPGGGPDIRVFNGATGAMIEEFSAYDPRFLAGVFVAAGDVNGDGKADIITGPDASGGPDVRVFFAGNVSGTPDKEFAAYVPQFTGGVRVAAADLNGDRKADIITAPGPTGSPDIRIFSGATLAKIGEFLAYAVQFSGGVFVAAGDVNGDHVPDIITGAGAGGGPEVRVFDGSAAGAGIPTPAILDDFYAYSPAFAGGVEVAATALNSDGTADILTGPGPGGGPHVRVFDGRTAAQLPNAFDSFMAFDPSFSGGVFVGAGS